MNKIKLSHFAEKLIASEIVRLGATIKEKISSGEQIYNYTIGDFDPCQFPIPAELEAEIVQAYHDRYTAYPAAEGELDLRQSISEFISDHLKIDYSPSEILVAAGGRPLIYSAYRTIVDKGDKVIYPVPSWNNNHYVQFTEGDHVIIEATRENNFMPTADQIKPFVKGAALIALCSPLNPTGTTFTKEELEAICDLVIEENESRSDTEKKLYLMYDQIYWTLTYGETVHYNPVSLRPKMKAFTIFIDGISKAFASTGVRVGWALAPAEVIVKMRGLNSHVGSWAPMAEQKAVAKYLRNKQAIEKYLLQFKNELEFRLRTIYDGIMELKKAGYPVDAIEPQAAIYLTISINLTGKKAGNVHFQNQSDVTSYLLNEARLGLVPFYAFGSDQSSNWYRLSVGCCLKEDITGILKNLEAALKKVE
ncbi:MAG: aminotransferase class I/II-fold pyridoxal phosphate-dependent enzyme [Ferruginibacter sp.]